MNERNMRDVIIIGSGPAGYSAAIYCARANLDTVIFTGMNAGGQLMFTTEVENYPGFIFENNKDYSDRGSAGMALMGEMQEQAKMCGAEIIEYCDITKVERTDNGNFKLIDDSKNEHYAKSIIIATGAQAKWLGLKSEEEFKNHGVSGCAVCDAAFYKGKDVIVIGGGDTAVEEALFLMNHVNKVTLVHRRDTLRASKILQDRLFKLVKESKEAAKKRIEIEWKTELNEVLGNYNEKNEPSKVTGALLKSTKDDTIKRVSIDGIFIAIGHSPNSSLFGKDSGCSLKLDNEGYIIANPDASTNIPGIYVAGDVQDKIYRQAVTAAGTGCIAALEVEKYLSDKQ